MRNDRYDPTLPSTTKNAGLHDESPILWKYYEELSAHWVFFPAL